MTELFQVSPRVFDVTFGLLYRAKCFTLMFHGIINLKCLTSTWDFEANNVLFILSESPMFEFLLTMLHVLLKSLMTYSFTGCNSCVLLRKHIFLTNFFNLRETLDLVSIFSIFSLFFRRNIMH